MKKEGLSLINPKDVITMLIPFPDIDATLAQIKHMYICWRKIGTEYRFVKCQSVKPYMLDKIVCKHYVDEEANEQRNPFKHTTKIDCDKVFMTKLVNYDNKMKTKPKSNVCQELYDLIIEELVTDGYEIIHLNESTMVRLNKLVTLIKKVEENKDFDL